MGGNMLGVGNCGQYTGEFNFYGDTESAKIVLDKYAQQVKLISNIISRIELTNHKGPSYRVSKNSKILEHSLFPYSETCGSRWWKPFFKISPFSLLLWIAKFDRAYYVKYTWKILRSKVTKKTVIFCKSVFTIVFHRFQSMGNVSVLKSFNFLKL